MVVVCPIGHFENSIYRLSARRARCPCRITALRRCSCSHVVGSSTLPRLYAIVHLLYRNFTVLVPINLGWAVRKPSTCNINTFHWLCHNIIPHERCPQTLRTTRGIACVSQTTSQLCSLTMHCILDSTASGLTRQLRCYPHFISCILAVICHSH